MSAVAVIGQGYVGLPLARESSRAGFEVYGIDVNPAVVSQLNAGHSHVDDVSDDDIATMIGSGYQATTDFGVVDKSDTVVICVPTPLAAGGEPDLGPLTGALGQVAEHMHPGLLVVIESTTYPGTTDEVAVPILERSGLSAGYDFYLAFSPERIDPGNPSFGLSNTPKIVGGFNLESGDRAADFYGAFVHRVVRAKGTREAEMAKLLENTYRHVNIALMNEMARFCRDLNVDLWDVIDAASTKPFGFQPFRPGPGVGGHCIPVDPNYLSHNVRTRLGYPFRLVELAQEINGSMPTYVASRVQDVLNTDGLAVKNARVLLLGVTYKPNVADTRETPAEPLAKILLQRGAALSFHDPYVDHWKVNGVTLDCVDDLDAAIQDSDICILLQSHLEYDVGWLEAKAPRLFDTRGVTTPSPNVERL